jgi:hypothetical protein
VKHRIALALGMGLAWILPPAAGAAEDESAGGAGADGTGAVHTERTFEFTAEGRMAAVAPLFGAAKERLWAPDWNPEFIWPATGIDRQGMVFTVAHAHGTAIWTNTAYDPENGRIQYAYVLPQTMATLITITLRAERARTRVTVSYARTSLRPEANALVEHMAEGDGRAGPEWAAQINGYLARPEH